MIRRIFSMSVVLLIVATTAHSQQGSVEDLPASELGGRFRDTSTGRTWLDYDNFLGRSFADIQASLVGTGFRAATGAEVVELLGGGPSAAFGEAILCFSNTLCQQGVYDDTASGNDPNLVGRAIASSGPDGGSTVITNDAAPSISSDEKVGAWVVQDTAGSCDVQGPTLDFDCDGKDDKVVWREPSGTWFVRFSSNGGMMIQQWGLPGDVPIAGDYDGDGVPDLAVWRPSSGTWFLKTSMTQYSAANSIVLQFGLPGDKPLRNDFDGDGRLDISVWRPTDGNFYAVRSSDAQIVVEQWGLSSDIPVVAAASR